MLKFFLILFLIHLSVPVDDDEVLELAQYIESELTESLTYQFPKDSSSYRSLNKFAQDYGTYDFIIVGAGSTGTVLANRLSEENRWDILLLEAGVYSNDFTDIPVMMTAIRNSEYNWGYNSTKQKYACLGMNNQECLIPRGRGVGGSSIINALMYVRGNPQDFDRWAALGNPGWSYQDVLKYFIKSENMNQNQNNTKVDWTYHGKGGPLNVEYIPSNLQTEAFFGGHQELGFNLTDINSPKQIGYTPLPVNARLGERVDGGVAFIMPVLYRRNLKVLTRALVTKINMLGKSARGVTFSYNGQLFKARAKKEVILSAGAINTPQLLMLSGIGPRTHLKKQGIHVIENLEVGTILREHPMYYGLTFSSNFTAPIEPFEEYVRDYLNGEGQYIVPSGISALSFHQSQLENIKDYPDLELLFLGSNCTSPIVPYIYGWNEDTTNAIYKDLNPSQCFSILPVALHAKSVGYVHLKSKDPYDFPEIDLNLLSDNRDIDTIYEGINLALKLVDTESFKKINASFAAKPLPACSHLEFLSKQYWYCSIAQVTYHIYHPVGSCPMGPDKTKGAVVDHELRVHGIKHLRVADASVFPFTLSGHPHAPCVMIGEKLSDILKKFYL